MSNNTLKKKSPITLRSKSSLNSKLSSKKRCVFSCKRDFFFFSIFRLLGSDFYVSFPISTVIERADFSHDPLKSISEEFGGIAASGISI